MKTNFLRFQMYKLVTIVIATIALPYFVNAQSKQIDNPTKLTSNEISGLVDSDTKGNNFYYSFWANPGEVSITLTVEPGRAVSDSLGMTSVSFTLYDRNAEALTNKGAAATACCGAKQAVARIEITKRQLVTLAIGISDGITNGGVGGKYRLRISGSADFQMSGGGISLDNKTTQENNKDKICFPSKSIIVIKMKDGSRKTIDLSEVEDIKIIEQ